MRALSGTISRRKLLAALGAGVAAAAIGRSGSADGAVQNKQRQNHLSWVWQFGEDGTPEHVRRVLSTFGVGILLKTHDGASWMSTFDQHERAIGGPRDIQSVARYFESAGVPFHAWCVVKGNDPIREAQMCAEVLSAGARSLTFDLEPPEGGHYWQAGPDEALEFGRELRRLQPNAWLSVAPDPRPWQVDVVPMAEFAAFSNEIAPQTYWDTFNSSANYRLLRDWGFEVGGDGVTPELILDVTNSALGSFGRPIRPVGQGTAHTDAWRRFVGHGKSIGMDAVSVWRFGRTTPDVWPLLSEMRPNQIQPPSANQPRDERDDDEDDKEQENRRSSGPGDTPQPAEKQTTTQSVTKSSGPKGKEDEPEKTSEKKGAGRLTDTSANEGKEWRWDGEMRSR
ncbi:MAG: hypothetical protein GEU75_09220 [Dehalococcoidia bacterium]|nr:hypothetical protein [Dehalococcoidia bacterium]